MKKLNSILFSLIAPQVMENAEGGAQSAELSVEQGTAQALDVGTVAAVFALAKKHDLGHFVAAALRSRGVEIADEALAADVSKTELTAVWRVRNFENEQGRVRKCFEKAEIPFILLKGAVIRDYYPDSRMRTSSDIDVLVPADKLAAAVDTLTSDYGYKISTLERHDASVFSPGGVHLDMHTRFDGDGEDARLTALAWQSATDKGGYERFLTPEHFYLLHVSHMAKHMKNGGCGIRSFIDLYLINSHLDYDRAAVREMLTERGLDRFESAALTLSERWMRGEDTAELSALAEYVITGGVYGSLAQGVASRRRKEGKLQYIFRRIFMPYSELKERHPRLDGHPWLTPVFWVWRWLGVLDPRRFKRSRTELKSVVKLGDDAVSGVASLLESLGL